MTAVPCVHCGALNDESATTCAYCGVALEDTAAPPGETHKASGKPIGHILLAVVCVLYLLNPTSGFDLIPDTLPIVGNLDEVGVMYLLLTALSELGWISLPRRE